jgi:tripartite-type tricarboxylate transporter receptor subunit TctC
MPVRASLLLFAAPAEFTDDIRADVRKWERVIRDANIKVE